MALSPTYSTVFDPRDKLMGRLVRLASITGPSAYVTGGISISNTDDFGWGFTQRLWGILSNGTTYYLLFLDQTNQKVIVVDPSTHAEVANGTVLSAYTALITAFGS